jgi:hypothetical protein
MFSFLSAAPDNEAKPISAVPPSPASTNRLTFSSSKPSFLRIFNAELTPEIAALALANDTYSVGMVKLDGYIITGRPKQDAL